MTLICQEDQDAENIFRQLWNVTNDFEDRFSRFKAESELSKFNHHAGSVVQVSQDFLDLLLVSQDMQHKTNNIFNPFILPALQRAGYIGSWPTPETFGVDQNYQNRLHTTAVNELELGSSWARIPDKSAIDFGGIGKGYLLKVLCSMLANHSVNNFWISLGGDIVCSGFNLEQTPWEIAIDKVITGDLTISEVHNDNGDILSIATSGIIKRKGIAHSKAWHHLIDPRTGEPAQTDILTATVISPDPINADVFAKCVVIVGSKQINDVLPNVLDQKIVVQLQDNTELIVA
jgi:thiamine biosynthesis lipoprotein